ncbi:MAG TPA: SRPBCC domain-containing protein [Trebonia sp.]
MRYYEASSTIAAGTEAVWAVLSDGPGWATWDSGVDGVEGRITAGGTVKIRSQAVPGRAFPVKVTAFEPLARLRFNGGLPLGIFRSVRTYELAPAAGGGTAFRVREEYTGPLLGLIWRSMPDLGPSFERFARGLKLRVKSGG